MRVLVVLGTRPEAIKLSPVIMEMRRRPDKFRVRVYATGQHQEMAEQAMSTFGIVPDYPTGLGPPPLEGEVDLATGLVSGSSLAYAAALALEGMSMVLQDARLDLVMVQGDTTSALAGALAAFYHKIPVAHVEAGLRTYDKTQPWPEEVNRRLITQIADWHFAPTGRAMRNLIVDGVSQDRIRMVGNTVIDALLWVKEKWAGHLNFDMRPGQILVTAHRRENWGPGIRNICEAIKTLISKKRSLLFIWPLHPNPIVANMVRRELGDIPQVILQKPFSYQEMVRDMATAKLILTDSGGIQEEAPTLNTPVLVLRDKTERPEAVECGAAKLVGTDPDRIVAEVTRLLTDQEEYERMANAENPFGDGHAAERIVEALTGGGP